jgi:hypothetical protein
LGWRRHKGAAGALVTSKGSAATRSLAAQLQRGFIEENVRVVWHGVFRTPRSLCGCTQASHKVLMNLRLTTTRRELPPVGWLRKIQSGRATSAVVFEVQSQDLKKGGAGRRRKRKGRPTRPDSDRARRAHVKPNCGASQARQFFLTITTPRYVGSLPNQSMRPYGTCGGSTTIS